MEGWGDAILTGGRYDNLLASFDSPNACCWICDECGLRGFLMRGIREKMPNVDILVHSEDGYEIQSPNYAANLAEQNLRCEKTASFQSGRNLWNMRGKWGFAYF